jgi:hypothetical protein
MINEKRGCQWDRFQIRVSGRVGGSKEKMLISDKYHSDPGEEGNPMRQVPK